MREINKTEQYTAKKLGKNNLCNASRTKNMQKRNKANQVGKQSYACKADDHKIKNCRNGRNTLLRLSDNRYTSTK